MTGDHALELLNRSADQGLPFGLRHLVKLKVWKLLKDQRFVVKADQDKLCKAARLVHAAVAFYASWTEKKKWDDQVAVWLDKVLKAAGCE